MDVLSVPSHGRMSYAAAMAEPDDDAGLMLRYAQGDSAAFETLYERHRGPLYRYFLRQCASRDTAAELFQDTWSKIIRAREGYKPSAKFTTWMYRIARNCYIDSLRRHGADPLADSAGEDALPAGGDANSVEIQADAQAFGERLAAALAELPAEQREAFVLRAEGGMGLAEIAAVTGVGRETVKSRLRYALARLRERLPGAGDIR